MWDNEALDNYKDQLWNENYGLGSSSNNESEMDGFAVPTVIWSGWIVSVAVFICEIIWDKVTSH